MRFIFLTTQDNYTLALREAAAAIRREHGIDLSVSVYMSSALNDPAAREQLAREIAGADFVFGAMLFGEALVRLLEELLPGAPCPVFIGMSNPSLIRLTRLGKFSLSQPQKEREGHGGLLQALRPKHGHGEMSRQLNLVKSLAKILKFLPGRFRDLHSYIVLHQYWIHNSPANMRRMLALMVERYVPGCKGRLHVEDPEIFPDVAIWHPDAPHPFADLKSYQKWRRQRRARLDRGVLGLVSLRVIVLGGNTAHLAALVRAVEARGIEARVTYTATLDGRPALEAFFSQDGRPTVDLLATTSGFALVGGMAQSKPDEARAALEALGVPFLQTIPLVFQRVEEWRADTRGLSPMHVAMNLALGELEGAVEPMVYGGPAGGEGVCAPVEPQIRRFAERVERRIELIRRPNSAKKIGLVLFSYPPNLGTLGTAAYLDVFASVYRLLQELRAAGYTVELPESAEALRQLVAEGNALAYGADANVADTMSVEDYRRLFPDSADIEPFWGRPPGEIRSDGKRLLILGRRLGNVFVGVQPPFGYERDPMRMLMSQDAAPNHGFAAFYTWLDKVFGADALLHVGTHGALEFMPGKQSGLGPECWPARLLGAMPNLYYYCVNNPSEGTIARRRGAATLVSYLVPPVQQAGLYRGLRQLKDSIEQYRRRPDAGLLEGIREQAARLGLAADGPGQAAPGQAAEAYLAALGHELLQVEQRMIPVGLHVLGRPPERAELVDILALVAAFHPIGLPDGGQATLHQLIARDLGYDYAALRGGLGGDLEAQARWQEVERLAREAVGRFVDGGAAQPPQGAPPHTAPLWAFLGDLLGRLRADGEIAGLLGAIGGRYIPPSPGNDVVRNPSVVPTGRNIHGLDPFHMPSAAAQAAGAALAGELLGRLAQERGAPPETVALILWGTDNIKTDGEGVAQALALLGARVVTDELGKVADVALIPLAELGRPRVDVVATVSGIFRDLMAHQAMLIAKAARMAAVADEPADLNFVRKHALAQAAELGVSVAEAAARVFSNAPGSYGANVNHMVESSSWDDDAQLGEVFLSRKGFAMTPGGEWREARPLLEQALGTVEAAFQNVDSVEVGISDVDHYYEYLGGVTKSVEKLRGARPATLVAEVEQFAGPGAGRVRSLEQMVRLESRAKLLNPKWFEGMLAHGYEGAHEIEVRVSNTYGWSATANAVEGWVYQGVADTYLLDEAMRERLAALNPHAAAGMARRLLEASERGFWQADESTLERLRDIYADLEDRLEGVAR